MMVAYLDDIIFMYFGVMQPIQINRDSLLYHFIILAITGLLASIPARAMSQSWQLSSNPNGSLIIRGAQPSQSFSINGTAYSVGEASVQDAIGDLSLSGSLLFVSDDASNHRLYHVRPTAGRPIIRHIPLWLSIVPPLVAIILALILKEVILSLFIGIWSGALIASGMSLTNLGGSLVRVIDTYVIQALADADHMSVIVFSLLIGGMVALISKNGGMAGVVQNLSRYANSRKRAQGVTYFLGMAIFFDDYANTLIVGNTMRSVTDKYRISREKLAYLVDSTAAPVAAIAFITTWIGAELGYIGDGISAIPDAPGSWTPYAIFIQSLKYSFYPILTLIFIYLLIRSGRDYGPMHAAEQRALMTGRVSSASASNPDEPDMEDLSPVDGAKPKAFNAVLPILVVIGMTILGLISTGMESTAAALADAGIADTYGRWGVTWTHMGELLDGDAGFIRKLGLLIGNSNSYVALLWASSLGVLSALLLTLGQKIMRLMDSVHWMTTGFKTMMPAVIILALAWALAITTKELHTADFLTSLLAGQIAPMWLPPIIFVLAAIIAFSTGSSWSTMAILYPIGIPTAWAVSQAAGMDMAASMEILLHVISVTLAASVLGDHCSPISDTTILSSLASDCNHLDHVKTQFPYAITVGAVSLMASVLTAALGGGWMLNSIVLVVCVAALYFIINKIGRPLNEEVT